MQTFVPLTKQDADELEEVEVEHGIDTRRGRNYRFSEALANAINVALLLGRPLLVSGQPGCGKTELGFAIARRLGIRRIHFFSAKSDLEARRLFYEFDALGRFQAAQTPGAPAERISPRNFIRYQALGRAILDAYGSQEVGHLATASYAPPERPTRSVVIVDEIDKAPRDFPNDLLNEIDQLWFRVDELALEQNTDGARPMNGAGCETPKTPISEDVRPIIVITSNIERQLPDAFLRRCIFHHIVVDKATREDIVKKRLLKGTYSEPELKEVFALIDWACQPGRLERAPGLAEAINFASAFAGSQIRAEGECVEVRFLRCVSSLAKSEKDAQSLTKFIQDKLK